MGEGWRRRAGAATPAWPAPGCRCRLPIAAPSPYKRPYTRHAHAHTQPPRVVSCHTHQVDGVDAVLRDGGHVVGLVAHGQDAAVHRGVQRLYAAWGRAGGRFECVKARAKSGQSQGRSKWCAGDTKRPSVAGGRAQGVSRALALPPHLSASAACAPSPAPPCHICMASASQLAGPSAPLTIQHLGEASHGLHANHRHAGLGDGGSGAARGHHHHAHLRQALWWVGVGQERVRVG
jgi:hypothetical protein